MIVLLDPVDLKGIKGTKVQWGQKETKDEKGRKVPLDLQENGDFLDALEIQDKWVWMVLMVFQAPQALKEIKGPLDQRETWVKWDHRVKLDIMAQKEL